MALVEKRPRWHLLATAPLVVLALSGVTCSSSTSKCQGRVTFCGDIHGASDCASQRSCRWEPAHCNGVRQYTCEILAGRHDECLAAGCVWQDPPPSCKPDAGYCLTCYGGYNSFSCKPYSLNLTKQSICETFGCTWEPEACTGSADSCDDFTAQPDCENQSGCAWQ